jgi:GxxExxY protein
VRDKDGILGINSEEGEVAFRGQLHGLTEKIIGIFFGVANELGPGFLESVYRRAMCVALREVGLRVEEEAALEVWFRGQSVGIFRADIIVEGLVLLELKTTEEITRQFEAQVLHYLRASTVEVGMVLAFGGKARFRRLTMKNDCKPGIGKTGTGMSAG